MSCLQIERKWRFALNVAAVAALAASCASDTGASSDALSGAQETVTDAPTIMDWTTHYGTDGGYLQYDPDSHDLRRGGPPCQPPTRPQGGGGTKCLCGVYVKDKKKVDVFKAGLPAGHYGVLVCKSEQFVSWNYVASSQPKPANDAGRSTFPQDITIEVLNVGPANNGCRALGVHASSVRPHEAVVSPRDDNFRTVVAPAPLLDTPGSESQRSTQAEVMFTLVARGQNGESFGEVHFYDPDNDAGTTVLLPLQFVSKRK